LVDTDRLAHPSDTAPQSGEAAPDILPLNEETDSGGRRKRARASSAVLAFAHGSASPRQFAAKRGAWSVWIFLVLFCSLFAEFIANDRP
jgi:hypothetical protein